MEFVGLGILTDLINDMICDPVIGFLMVAIYGPFCMAVLAAGAFEWRVVPIGKGQSASFFPGELLLIVSLAGMLWGTHLVPNDFLLWWQEYGALIAFAVSAFILWLMRTIYDAPRYDATPGATSHSASKWAHDIFGYFWYPFVIIITVVPTVVNVFVNPSLATIGAVAVAIAPFVAWAVLDVLFDLPSVDCDLAQMHPDDSNCWYRKAINKLRDKALQDLRGGNKK